MLWLRQRNGRHLDTSQTARRKGVAKEIRGALVLSRSVSLLPCAQNTTRSTRFQTCFFGQLGNPVAIISGFDKPSIWVCPFLRVPDFQLVSRGNHKETYNLGGGGQKNRHILFVKVAKRNLRRETDHLPYGMGPTCRFKVA